MSKIRRDGRALRIVQKGRQSLDPLLLRHWESMADDLRLFRGALSDVGADAVVVEGDGRAPTEYGVERESVDIVVTSPPYPNNIDYSEVYKLELWLLGMVSSTEGFLALRKRTFRSHPTCAEPERPPEYESALQGDLKTIGRLRALLDRVPGKWRSRVVDGYFSDLWTSMTAHFACLRSGGFAAYVLGNSLHGGPSTPYLIPADLLAAEIARLVGFKVERLVVARPFTRRLSGNHFLRESVLVLRK